ncbi:hypothetical protein NA57DRAFT_55241 [Rhizodiscina lignyota]|uniref:Uncharacterized protein n=1 Tax=Rhizodiscina lignyota TaxID=1504668 RepID=A0A9P4M6U3_9PEZI|nr:hypothetical protein NA57DRAFT_55241 [Rhizodiscina lignyota]
MASPSTDAQQQAIVDMMLGVFTEQLPAAQRQLGPQGAPGQHDNREILIQQEMLTPRANRSTRAIVHSGQNTYIRNFWIFTERLRDAATLFSKETVKLKIPSMLRSLFKGVVRIEKSRG